MPKRKLERFAAIETFPNVFNHIQTGPSIEDFVLKGKWNNEYFKNQYPLVLELGCGKGEYTVGLAERFKNKNFIGIDLKGNRLWRGAKTALDTNLTNVAFIRMRIDNIFTAFNNNEVSEIWITFPDPQLSSTRTRKRLTSPNFLSKYAAILEPNGIIHLKTDNVLLFEYTLKVIKENNYLLLEATSDLYGKLSSKEQEKTKEILSIQTFYERKFIEKGCKICYIKFCLF